MTASQLLAATMVAGPVEPVATHAPGRRARNEERPSHPDVKTAVDAVRRGAAAPLEAAARRIARVRARPHIRIRG
jgi:hypothetical protein